jgi:hypothetical protein
VNLQDGISAVGGAILLLVIILLAHRAAKDARGRKS